MIFSIISLPNKIETISFTEQQQQQQQQQQF